jgi:hypothetical protein
VYNISAIYYIIDLISDTEKITTKINTKAPIFYRRQVPSLIFKKMTRCISQMAHGGGKHAHVYVLGGR